VSSGLINIPLSADSKIVPLHSADARGGLDHNSKISKILELQQEIIRHLQSKLGAAESGFDTSSLVRSDLGKRLQTSLGYVVAQQPTPQIIALPIQMYPQMPQVQMVAAAPPSNILMPNFPSGGSYSSSSSHGSSLSSSSHSGSGSRRVVLEDIIAKLQHLVKWVKQRKAQLQGEYGTEEHVSEVLALAVKLARA